MSLIDLKTNLKSLKFGNDKRGGGSSNQPYIVTPIPDGDDSLDNKLLYGTGGPDILIRGGTLTAKRLINDNLRISKFFTDLKSIKGLLFINNQNILSRLASKTEASLGPSYGGGAINQGIYNPLNTLLQINSSTTGIRLNQKGLDPMSTFDGFSLNRYENIVNKNNKENNNRLVNLFKNKIIIDDFDPVLIKYQGGPGSVLGIGNTKIKRSSKTGTNNYLNTLNKGYFTKGGLINSFTDRNDIQFNGNKLLGASDSAFVEMDLTEPIDNGFSFPDGQQLKFYGPQDDNSTLSLNNKGIDLLLYQNFQKSYRKKDNKDNIGSTNSFGLHPWGNEDFGDKDIIKFIITLISNNNSAENEFLYFPALLDSFEDSFNANWTTEKIMGRGEDFFSYDGFSRDINLTFKVYARDKDYLIKMYDNLNKLASSMTPEYSSNGFMKGNLFKLTIGKYIEDLPGIIISLNFTPSLESNWDIEENTQLPHLIDVSISFKPIHNYLPNKNTKLIARNYEV